MVKNRDQDYFERVQIPDSAWEREQLAAGWNLNSKLPLSKLPIKTPTLRHIIAKGRPNEQPVLL